MWLSLPKRLNDGDAALGDRARHRLTSPRPRRGSRRSSGSPSLSRAGGARRGRDRRRLSLRRAAAGNGRGGVGGAARPSGPGRVADARAARGRCGDLASAGDLGRGLAGSSAKRARGALLARDGARAAPPRRALPRRASPGSARGRDGRTRSRRPPTFRRRPCGVRRCSPATCRRSRRSRCARASTVSGRFRLTPLRPITPMLAQTADDVHERARAAGSRERRVEARRRAYPGTSAGRRGARSSRATSPTSPSASRRSSLPLRALDVSAIVLDGEAIALRDDGRPEPFQVTMSRFGTKAAPSAEAATPLSAFFFDCLHLDGDDLIDAPAQRATRGARRAPAARARRAASRDRRRRRRRRRSSTTRSRAATRASWSSRSTRRTRRAGAVRAGSRSSPRTRSTSSCSPPSGGTDGGTGKLSNLHLGARDPASGGFVMLGKTFKGMTDEMLAWQTEHLLGLETQPRRARRPRSAGARRRDRVRRRAGEPALSGRRGASLRAREGLPAGQVTRRRRTRSTLCARSTLARSSLVRVRSRPSGRLDMTQYGTLRAWAFIATLVGVFGMIAALRSARSCGRSRSRASGRRSACSASDCPSRSSSRRSRSRSRRRCARSPTSATRWRSLARWRTPLSKSFERPDDVVEFPKIDAASSSSAI